MPTKKPLKKTRPSAPVDLRTPAEIAVDELRRSVRDIRKDADDNGAALEAFAVELRGVEARFPDAVPAAAVRGGAGTPCA